MVKIDENLQIEGFIPPIFYCTSCGKKVEFRGPFGHIDVGVFIAPDKPSVIERWPVCICCKAKHAMIQIEHDKRRVAEWEKHKKKNLT